MRNPTPNVNCKYGAPMGRHVGPISEGQGDKWALQHVPLDSGGYDRGGAYWGHHQRLYWAFNESTHEETFFRARDRAAAKAHVRAEYDSAARFYR